jgi:outer membrane receptor protein involved in Fe transport
MAFALAFASSGMAVAQSTPAPDAPAPDDIVVTGTHIVRDGYKAPTPVTVLTADALQAQAPSTIAQSINQLPQFRGTTTPTSTVNSSQNVGGNFLDLRGVGASRTMVLVNGRRVIATTADGLVDINLLPQDLVKRVDVVTGGASAAYGSDAVSGVVNFILDDHYSGVRISSQFGISGQGDDQEVRTTLTAGTAFSEGRGHVVVSGEYFDSKGIPNQYDRDWGAKGYQLIANPTYTATNGQPKNIIAANVYQAGRSEGGLILAPASLRGIDFLPGGTLGTFTFGSPLGSSYMVGGSGTNQGRYTSLEAPLKRYTAAALGSYEFSPAFNLHLEMNYGYTRVVNPVVQSFSTAPYTITSSNAYLPAALASLMTANNVSSVSVGRINTDFGFITADITTKVYRGVLGLDGDLGHGWKWSAYYEYGRTRYDGLLRGNLIPANLSRAINAVKSPGGGSVCADTLSGTASVAAAAAGCVPINLFGYGSPSAQAIAYVTGTQELLRTVRQDVASANIQGEPFSTWAGKVSVAAGAEYRREGATVSVDALSAANSFLIGNPKGYPWVRYNVKEAYGETVIPLLAESPIGKGLDLTAAVRETDYSTSGSVTTWKAGLNYTITDDVRLRATRSRDIRAPNLSELYLPNALSFATLTNPTTREQTLVQVNTQGNTSLRPEKANTWTVGAVFSPRWVTGLSFSIDAYDIRIKSAIITLAAQDIVNRCFAGTTSLCPLVTQVNGSITSVVATYINAASVKTRGLDFELTYVKPLPAFGATMIFHGLANYTDRLSTSDGVTSVDRAGEVDPDYGGVPHWQGSASITLDKGPLSGMVMGRFVGGGKYLNSFVEGVDINDNSVSGRFYVNTSISYKIKAWGSSSLKLFGVINNLLDKDPPVDPSSFQTPFGTNPALYDVIGRSFVFGARVEF